MARLTADSKPITGIFGAFAGLAAAIAPACAAGAPDFLARPPEDEVIYFVLPDRFENADPANDRGGIGGDRLANGYNPSHKGFFHGGDLKGLTRRLDYIDKLGATAIWLGPIYKNKPVQGPKGDESAGYHGYWITDFTAVDPHFGTAEDLGAFVAAAHARGIKVYLDIIANHTADVIKYRECHDPAYDGVDRTPASCPYRFKADYPYSTRGPVSGERINEGFQGDGADAQTPENFERLKRADYAYTPYVPAGEENAKTPAWLNDPIYYHNRGDSNWYGEGGLYGDFSGLDDLMTEHPAVVAGMIDIYNDWITKYRIDGFRVDTARHVNPEFWRAFNAAMVAFRLNQFETVLTYLDRYTRVDGFPATLDFAFQAAVTDVVAKGAATTRLADLFALDALYQGGEEQARRNPVFIGNHDMGRFAMFVRQADPSADDDVLLKRVALGHAMMFFLRGAPVVYYGDEQGFNGDGNDQASREDMFKSEVASYNDNDLIGSGATTAAANFDAGHPLFRSIAQMAKMFHANEALRRGRQVTRLAEPAGALFAVSRFGEAGGEYVVAFNAGAQARDVNIEIDRRSLKWTSVHGKCANGSGAPGSYRLAIPAYDYVICRSNEWRNVQ